MGGPDAGSALPTSVGSGSVEGTVSFDVVTARWRDPGPFNGRSRVEIALSTDAACGRPLSCDPYTELLFVLSAEGEITPGRYELFGAPEGDVVGNVDVDWVTVQSDERGCSGGRQPGVEASVILESFTDSELRGSFDIQVLMDGEPVVTGDFAALRCPGA